VNAERKQKMSDPLKLKFEACVIWRYLKKFPLMRYAVNISSLLLSQ